MTFLNRPEIAKERGLERLLWAPDYGALIKAGGQWWATNDKRYGLIGVVSNDELVQPTVGPFGTREKAEREYAEAKKARR